jgi:outer membrane protein assembly factor BamB
VATPVVCNDYLFVSSAYDGALLLKLDRDQPVVEQLWRRKGTSERATDALHCLISTPLMDDANIYGNDMAGVLRCLDVRTGDRLWENKTALPQTRFSTTHFVRQGENIWLFTDRGELIIAKLTPQGYHELSRTELIKPAVTQSPDSVPVCWAHPAFSNKHIYARNDAELVCAELAVK